ncbi:MAG: DNA polymerase III subunit gamma/tau [Mariprofundales bacterium]|nr:DNA polymerase III subunit gamma/tau [Mariprofundales bacterium]
MSYIVLARRFRPQRFDELVGQQIIARTLKNALSQQRLAHAYLLTGIRGVGKTTIARIMAMGVNCVAPQDGEPCGKCSHCTSIVDGSAMDVIEMDAASHTGVDDVRELMASVRYPPTTMAHKVYIIDEAHMLSTSAFNALLKTLEEPPAHALFILATTESDKLPITVRSRCQRFDLGRLTVEEIRDHLQAVLTQEKITAEPAALTALAQSADGSVRDALSLTERVLSLGGEQITLNDVQQALGLIGQDTAQRLAHPILAGDAAEAVRQLRELVQQGQGARHLLASLTDLLHQLTCLKIDPTLVDANTQDHGTWLQQQAERFSHTALDARYQILLTGLQSLTWVDETRGAEMVVMRLAMLNQLLPPDSSTLPQAPDQQKNTMSPPSAPTPPIALENSTLPTTTQCEVAEPAPTTTAPWIGRGLQNWDQALEAYQQQRPALAAVLDHVRCRSFDDQRIELALNSHQQHAISAEDRRQFQQWIQREVLWLTQQTEDQSLETRSHQRDRYTKEEQARLWRQAEHDPHIQALVQELGCQLVAVHAKGCNDDAPELATNLHGNNSAHS